MLDWDARNTPKGRRRLALVRELLAIRRKDIVPRLAGAAFGFARADGAVLSANWRLGDGSALYLIANLSKDRAQGPRHVPAGRAAVGRCARGRAAALVGVLECRRG